MFFFRKLMGLFFIGLLVFALLGLFGGRAGSGFDSAYRQGFIDGQQAATAGSEGAEGSVPSAKSGTNIYYRDHSLFFPGPALLLCLVPLFAFGFMAMKSGMRHGRRAAWGPCGPGPRHWKHGPWEQWQDGPKEKSPDDIDDGPEDTVRYA
jgi:hypothetical protein